MGVEVHRAIVVTASYAHDEDGRHWIEHAHEEARRIFGPLDPDISQVVTPPTPRLMNNSRSLLVAPDGSKEGWKASDEGDTAREEFIAWLKEVSYGDGSSPLEWVEVEYGPDAEEAKVLRSQKAERIAAAERERAART